MITLRSISTKRHLQNTKIWLDSHYNESYFAGDWGAPFNGDLSELQWAA
jgi:hypothetical protein